MVVSAKIYAEDLRRNRRGNGPYRYCGGVLDAAVVG